VQGFGEARADQNGVRTLALGLGGVVAVACALALDLHGGVVEVDVGPGEGERFGDTRAGADEQLGERLVVSRARAQVGIDLAEAQVGELAMLDRERTDEAARVARE